MFVFVVRNRLPDPTRDMRMFQKEPKEFVLKKVRREK